jgi:hypothetical protein
MDLLLSFSFKNTLAGVIRISILFVLCCSLYHAAQAQGCITCDVGVTTVNVNLSAKEDTIWTYSSTRNGICCGQLAPKRCIRFNITLNQGSEQLKFATSPAPPGGARYQIDCGTEYSSTDSVCVTGLTSFCQVGRGNGRLYHNCWKKIV